MTEFVFEAELSL